MKKEYTAENYKRVKDYKMVMDEILPGMGMFVRDVNLPEEIAEKYEPGKIIMHKGYTEASSRVAGMVATHRFAILSNRMVPFEDVPYFINGNSRSWGMHMVDRYSHFKVLDVYEYEGKTQILLLHLPYDKSWRVFKNGEILQDAASGIEGELIEQGRARFEEALKSDPIPELQSQDWREICQYPIGINEDGEFFDLEPPLERFMFRVGDTGFRSFYHKFVYIECRDHLMRLLENDLMEDDNGAIFYGYIDEQSGLCFHLLRIAALKEKEIIIRDTPPAMMILRYEDLKECDYLDLSQVDIDLSFMDRYAAKIRKIYDTDNEHLERIRSFTFLDECRDDEQPDDIAVLLLHEGSDPERVWVKGNYTDAETHKIYGTLLNEPLEDLGVHRGDRVQIVPCDNDRGGITCVSRV